ncbi:DUF4382 domain-containing protein [Mangrovimonas spongiae]|uniref:DUF4382 domain-containing protein n=1 Tax=Mangrovimonas spongiae TaxID=2494697 RepID=A0A3R9UWJ7_9FLAO|nr:DUF4382 domain-containing protein [Mangrovimonas spongiae]RSK41635.1 DUF4382 domain-containing protein [Mangrovimonas spongiae]
MRAFKQLKLIYLSLLALTLTFFNCSDDNNSTPQATGESFISVKLVDDPGDYDNVFVEVVDVMVKVNDDSESESGWVSLDPINTGVYDLLDLTGGVNVLLADDFQIPSGTLNQIRLVLGEDNSIVIDGETHPLNTPSAQQSGLKVQVNQTIEPGYTYDYILDFDVDESIVVAGNSGNINLKPVIRATAEVSSGKIEGMVTLFDFQVQASVTTADGDITAYADENGAFMLNGVPGGTYTVTITPDPESVYAVATVENVEVVNGQVTNIGTVELQEIPVVGSITGTILNEGVSATVSVMVEGEVVEATTDEAGVFLLADLPVGFYDVTITPDEASGLAETVVPDVEVTQDMTTDLGEMTLE